MSIFEAIILGIIQGITEFLPVSSSGHLKLAQHFFHLQNLSQFILFDLICHIGTLFAIFMMFRKEIRSIFTSDKTKLFQIFLATLPLFPLVLLLKPIKSIFNNPEYLGYCFIATSIILYLGIKLSEVKPEKTLEKRRFIDPLIIGISQSVAILPGISRSGSTISTAKILGWTNDQAVTFSFLLAIPAILGGLTLELFGLIFNESQSLLPDLSFTHYFVALITSFIFGYFSLSLLKRLASKQKFMYFVWYCLLIGILTIFYI